MSHEMNTLFAELTEAESAALQGGIAFGTNIPYFAPVYDNTDRKDYANYSVFGVDIDTTAKTYGVTGGGGAWGGPPMSEAAFFDSDPTKQAGFFRVYYKG